MSDDIKDLLGRAIGDEPPLGIDREDVFDAGRKRLRRRRLIQSSSVVAAVVVVAAGAMTLIATNPNSAPELPPAATGPTEPGHSTTNHSVPSSKPPPPTTTTRDPVAAANLTDELYAVLPPDSVVSENTNRPMFEEKGDRFYITADVQRLKDDGALTVTVAFDHTRDQARCSDVPAYVEGCTMQVVDGVTVAYGDYQYGSGERGFAAVAVLPGRVKVDAIASNYPGWQRKQDKRPEGDPVFSKNDLAEMLVRAGFSAG